MEKSRGPYKVSRIAEAAGVAALDDRSGWAERTTAECVANRGRVFEALRQRGVAPLPSAVDERHPPRYRPINWREFRSRRAAGDYANAGEYAQISQYVIKGGGT